jgi:hypothetical protein
VVPLRDLPYRIPPAIGIRCVQLAFRIVAPMAIHDKSIAMRAGFKFDACFPSSAALRAQRNRPFLPARKVTGQPDAPGAGGGDREYLFLSFVFLRDIAFFLALSGKFNPLPVSAFLGFHGRRNPQLLLG